MVSLKKHQCYSFLYKKKFLLDPYSLASFLLIMRCLSICCDAIKHIKGGNKFCNQGSTEESQGQYFKSGESI